MIWKLGVARLQHILILLLYVSGYLDVEVFLGYFDVCARLWLLPTYFHGARPACVERPCGARSILVTGILQCTRAS